ncbi:MAG: FAD-dependent oxidoreductase, partial [Armatimonadetes bacterium]|nr:FAD-dependent oxidoreductase [Armatimonadota bacterium]
MNVVWEEPRRVEVIEDCDVCVIGGSTTGVFAAIAAARLGARVALVENGGYFGGTATASLVCIWHSHLDTRFEREIIGGLTMETLGRLLARGGASQQQPNDSLHYILQPYELVLELDQMVTEANIRPFLHTRFVAPVVEEGRVTAAIIEDKTGRRAIAARVFVDASGDGDLVHRAGFRTYKMEGLQPPTTCAVVQGLAGIREQVPDFRLQCVFDPQYPEHLPPGLLWAAPLAGTDMTMIAGTRVHQADCSDADQLTRAELEGRRQVASMLA